MTDRETFRHVIGHFASGVTVVTTRYQGIDSGATASAVSSLSLEPPMLLISMNLRGATQQAVAESGVFGLNILDEDQAHLAELFARPAAGDRFAGLTLERGPADVPVLPGTLAFCACEVTQYVDAATHRVFLARVTAATARDGFPLTYFRGRFGRFEADDDQAVYHEIRRRILHRVLPIECQLDLPALAQEFSVPHRVIYHAIGKLVGEGLVDHDPVQGYRVCPVTLESAGKEYDARTAMELGVVALTVGKVTGSRLDRLRAALEQSRNLLVDGKITDAAAYAQRTQSFHAAIIDLADNETLSQAYRRLGFAALTLSVLGEGSQIGQDISDDHAAILHAFESSDLPAALELVAAHNEHVKVTIRQALIAAGGRV